MKTLLILLTLITFNAQADDSIIIGYGSYHMSAIEREGLNQVNPALGFELNDFQVVYMNENSWDKNSVYATYAPDYKINDYLSVTAQVGFATGYKCGTELNGLTIGFCTNQGVIPMAAATINYAPVGKGLTFSLSANPMVAMFSVKYTFN